MGGASEVSELEVLCLVPGALRKAALNRGTRKLTPCELTSLPWERDKTASSLVLGDVLSLV